MQKKQGLTELDHRMPRIDPYLLPLTRSQLVKIGCSER